MYLTPSHLKQLCQQYDLTPSKKYGQNYLISQAPIEKMLDASGIQSGDKVVEIGPGFGVLTFALLERGADVTAFEIERKLEPYWQEKKKIEKLRNLEIIWGDVLKEIRSPIKSGTKFEIRNFKVVANLPYQITSHVLRTLLELDHKPESITVMVQKEVAERIVAKPGDMSILAVSVQYYGTPHIVCQVPKGNFWPSPKVDSAVIHLDIQTSNHAHTFTDEEFFKIVRSGFANKRKQLWSNLSKGLFIEKIKVQKFLVEVCGNEKVRAQELSVEQWITLVKKLT